MTAPIAREMFSFVAQRRDGDRVRGMADGARAS